MNDQSSIDGIGRVDGRLLPRILDYVARDKASTLEDIAKLLKVSEHTERAVMREMRGRGRSRNEGLEQ